MLRPTALIACLLAPAALPAQVSTGTINVEVQDTSGAAAPGAAITLTHVATGQVREGKSNEPRADGGPAVRSSRRAPWLQINLKFGCGLLCYSGGVAPAPWYGILPPCPKPKIRLGRLNRVAPE